MLHNLLLVDDEESVISSLKRAFMDQDFQIYSANSGAEGLSILAREPIQVIVSDEKMPGMSGAEFLAQVRTLYPDTIRFMLTGQASMESAMKAINEGEIYRFFTKPWDNLQLVFAIRSAFEKFDLEDENRRLLSTIRLQAVNLRILERQYPDITKLEKDEQGNIIISDMTEAELADIVRQCEKAFDQ